MKIKCSLIRLLLISEFVFSLGLEVLKTTTGFVFSHELSLNFADAIEQDESILYYLVTGGVASFILGLLSDLYLGKYYPTMFGLFMALASSGFGFVSFLTKIPIKACLIAYMTTSQIRNSIIIEQLRVKESKELRICIFYMVYMRLVGRGFFLILTQLNYATSTAMDVALGISCAVFLFYLIFFITAGGFFYIESVYINILCRMAICVRNTIPSKRDDIDSRARYYAIKQKKIEETANEPMPNKTYWGYSAITKNQPDTSTVQKSPDNSPSPNITAEENGGYLSFLYWLFPYMYNKRKTVELKKDFSKSVLAMSGPSDTKQQIVDSTSQTVKKEKCFTLTSDKYRLKPSYIFNDNDLERWLFRAAPKSSNYIILQTMKLQEFTRYIFLGFIYIWLCLFITSYTSHQEAIASKNDEWVLASTGLRVVSFSVIFELILFPVVELIFVPVVCNYFKNSLGPIALGHFILLLAGFAMLLIQIILVRTVPYIPEIKTAQIRIYNPLLIKTTVYSDVTGYKEIRPLDFIFVSDIHTTGNFPMRVTFEDGRKHIIMYTNITIEANTTSSYTIRNGLMTKNINEPTILFKEVFVSKIFVIMDKDYESGAVVCKDREDVGKKIEYLTVMPNTVLDIEPSSYEMTILRFGKSLYVSNHTFERGSLSALFLNTDRMNPAGNIARIEGPVVILFEHLLFHTFLKSLANAFATVTFFRNAYVQSPEKLRSSLFGFMFMLNFLTYAALSTDVFFYHGTRGVHTTYAILFYSGHVVIFIISMLTLYR